MQFVANGPDIPNALLQAHEDGRVVFFCGAGISYPAGLPGFKGLVDKIYQGLGTDPTPIEQDAYERNQFDATLDLLEERYPGQRIAVRRALADVLQPKWRRKGATDTHAALLRLARTRDGALRIVTTNFDRVFDRATQRTKQSCVAHVAPMLPIPKNSRWNGLVYLHGRLPAKLDDTALHRLVVTSGDFGLAYLIERWAARFVSELFRNYVVCFVGYSINDPILRYMMDALAADRILGEVTPQAYALGDYEFGQKEGKAKEWAAKRVTPILYEVPTGGHDHSALHETLKGWADTYRDGVHGRERIVVDYALARPSASTRQDDFVGRMLWALAHDTGLPAKRFADFDPVPPIEWLEAFSEERFRPGDLNRFGVVPRSEADPKLQFSLLRRPAPYSLAPSMTLVLDARLGSEWDEVMFHLARWLTRHLNDPKLIFWLVGRGSQLHQRWRWLIEHRLDHFAALEREGKTTELDEIRANAPNAIPSPPMQTLWRLLLTDRVKSPWRDPELHSWRGRLKRDGLTATLRMELRKLLEPKIALKRPLGWRDDDATSQSSEHLKQHVDWDLVLTADHVGTALHDLLGESSQNAVPPLLDEFQQLLRDALDLMRELGEANDRADRSNWDLPSISEHWQNRGFRDWVVLIELLRDAWLVVRKVDPTHATRIGQGWFELPYPTFKRLALFAASQDDCIASEQWVDWLAADNALWLWSMHTQREVMRLLVLHGSHLTGPTQDRLETAVLAGPHRKNYRDDITPERLENLVQHAVWLRLAKLDVSGLALGADARSRLETVSRAHPGWQLAADERDEFSSWMSGTGDPDYEESRDIDVAPSKRRDLAKWLKQPPPEDRPLYEDTWRETCRTRFAQSVCALCDLSREDVWPTGRWRVALETWSEDRLVQRSWRYAAPLVQTMPDNVLQGIAHSVTWWMEVAAKSTDRHETILLDLCRRLLEPSIELDSGVTRVGEPINQPVSEAINHPIGHTTRALLNLWSKRGASDNDLLPADIEPFLTRLCDTHVAQYRHGRVLLASRLIALFRVDRRWTEEHLLPLFSWSVNPEEAKGAWEGFLWSARLYRPLLASLRSQFLETACHYADLGSQGGQFAAFLTNAALESVQGYTPEDFRLAIAALPQEGLQEAAQALLRALEGAGDQREEYWINRVQPFWKDVWPKSRNLATEGIARTLAQLSIAAGMQFPAALTAVLDWLKPIEHTHHIVHRLHESSLCSSLPADALRLLGAVINDQRWAPRELGLCLEVIKSTSPELATDPQYQRLEEYSRQRGI